MRTGGKQMQKLKYVLVILFTAAVIAFCAVLPMAVAHFQDVSSDGKVIYSDMRELQLNIKELSIYEKLYLLRHAQALEVDEGKAQMSQAELKAAVETGLKPYIEAGFVKTAIEDMNYESTAMLFYDVINAEEMTGIFWSVTMNTYFDYGDKGDGLPESNEGIVETYISLIIDDDTGKIMSMQVITPQEGYYDEMRLWEICEIYFSNLGLSDEVIASLWENTEFSIREPETYCMLFISGDIFYGELGIEFNLFEGGFYNSIY